MLNGTPLDLRSIGDLSTVIDGCVGSQCSVTSTQAHQRAMVISCAQSDAANDLNTRATA